MMFHLSAKAEFVSVTVYLYFNELGYFSVVVYYFKYLKFEVNRRKGQT